MQKLSTIVLAALTVISIGANADDDINYSFSLKSWNTAIHNDGYPATQHTNAPIFSGTVKKGDYFLTANYLLPASYTSTTDYTTRRDVDFALGWNMNSNISLLAGKKQISANKWDFTSWNRETANIAYFGFNGFTTLSEKDYLYGTLTRSFNATDTNQDSSHSLAFTSSELGYGYLFNQNTQLSFGYRDQRFAVNGGGASSISGFIFGVTLTK